MSHYMYAYSSHHTCHTPLTSFAFRCFVFSFRLRPNWTTKPGCCSCCRATTCPSTSATTQATRRSTRFVCTPALTTRSPSAPSSSIAAHRSTHATTAAKHLCITWCSMTHVQVCSSSSSSSLSRAHYYFVVVVSHSLANCRDVDLQPSRRQRTHQRQRNTATLRCASRPVWNHHLSHSRVIYVHRSLCLLVCFREELIAQLLQAGADHTIKSKEGLNPVALGFNLSLLHIYIYIIYLLFFGKFFFFSPQLNN